MAERQTAEEAFRSWWWEHRPAQTVEGQVKLTWSAAFFAGFLAGFEAARDIALEVIDNGGDDQSSEDD